MSEDLEHEDEQPAAQPLTAQQIASFWRDFSGQLAALNALEPREFVERAGEILEPYAPDLALELEGNPNEAGARLVVTAHGNIAQFENVQALVRGAPRLDGYAVQAFRSRSLGQDFSMNMNDFELSCSDVLVAHYDAGGIVGLELSFEKIVPQDMIDHARHMAFIMLDHVLGEWDFSVRVGPVEFVDAFSDSVAGAEPLSVFPAIFDAFQRDELGRSYEFPREGDERWISLEVRPRDAQDDAPPDILTFHDSANALATRADLSHFLSWRLPFASQQELDAVRDAQDALEAALRQQQRGVLAFSRVEDMSTRLAAFYVDDVEHASALAGRLGAEHASGLESELHATYDPSWREFLGLYGAIHASQAGEGGDA
ncbi:hypothetical protein [Diaphorobacter aerolatus]|uniref:DUF695 domain-containing protein n=1 Tax=Diaphorobacter aerolatus TaxID=1288495 RepID=A0A7H0GHB6_9BURK|nr:hypothetical protein [Diaphorobacter aerolatus]QNP47682.1 hypothetical protein H9K75_15960 [Diaphorobacter aerolatus]